MPHTKQLPNFEDMLRSAQLEQAQQDFAPEGELPEEKPKQTKKSTSRKPKEGARAARKQEGSRQKLKDISKINIGLRISVACNDRFRMAAAKDRQKYPSEFFEETSLDRCDYSYECTSPGCGARFNMQMLNGVEPGVPTQCPICGSNKLTHIKYL